MSLFIFRLLFSFAALLPLGLINAPGDAGAGPSPAPEASWIRTPIIFFVAKGPTNACGPGCSEWIAAEGDIDRDAAKRFRDFLATLSRRDLPVFFNSLGGLILAGIEIGTLLREHHMTVAIGRTVPEGCRNAAATDDACRRVMQSQLEHRARLITAGARCVSACVNALMGGSVRQVAPDAQVGVHSVRRLKGAPSSADEIHRILKRLTVEFGGDPGLIDAGAKISADSVRYLSREEIARFGVETRGVFETAWLPYLETDKRPAVLKSVTHPKGAGGKQYRTSSIQISCYGGGPSLWFAYRRELASDEIGLATAIRAAASGVEFAVGDTAASSTSVDRRIVTRGGEFLAQAIAAPAIVITETFIPAGNELAWSREIKFSTSGLAKSVNDLQKSCTPSPAVAAAAEEFQTCYAASGDVAISACTRAIASGRYRGRDLATLYNNRGAEWRATGELDRAFADLNEALRLDPKHANAFYNRGLAWYGKGDLDRAIAEYDEAIRFDPEFAAAYVNRSAVWRAKGELDRAIADYDEAIRLDPKHASTYYNRGTAWRAKGELDRAIADYDEAIRLDPKFRSAYNNRGLAWRDKGDLDRAIADFDEAIRFDPKYSAAYYNRGLAWRDKGDLDRAIADFTEATRLDPKFRSAYNNRGLAWRDKGDLDRAIADFDEAIRLDPKFAFAYNNHGLVLRAKRELDRAIADFDEAIRLDPKYSAAYYNRGLAWRDKGDLDRAIADFTEATRLDPKFRSAYNDRGLAWRAKGDLDRAIADFNEAIRLDPKFAFAYNNHGLVLRAKGELDRAIADFDEAIRLDSKYSAAYYNRGLAWRDKGDLDRAIADFTEAIGLNPKYALAYTNRGLAWRDKGEPDRAIADFNEVIRLNPKHAESYLSRGLTRLYGGAAADALADIDKASELDPKSAYKALWVDIVGQRNGLASRLEPATATLDMTKWPAPVVRLFLGELMPVAVLAAADDLDAKRKKEQLCEANFFSGIIALRNGAADDAAKLFRLAVDECPRNFIESYAANAELKQLGR